MAITYDPEVAKALAEAAAKMGDVPIIERGDVASTRDNANKYVKTMFDAAPVADTVTSRDITFTADDATSIRARLYQPRVARGSAVVYAHGGGMIAGSIDLYDRLLRYYTEQSDVPFLAIDYRLAPEHTGDRLAKDVFAGILWLHANAGDLGIDPSRIAVMGDSGGGGVAAGAAILARDNNIPLTRQILVYPMLDDRNTVDDPQLAELATWTYDNNYTGWHALLGDAIGTDDVSPIASPAHLTDFRELPPTRIEVGDLDIFRDESIAYATKLLAAGVSCELHVHPGAPHGYEWLAADAAVSLRTRRDRIEALQQL